MRLISPVRSNSSLAVRNFTAFHWTNLGRLDGLYAYRFTVKRDELDLIGFAMCICVHGHTYISDFKAKRR